MKDIFVIWGRRELMAEFPSLNFVDNFVSRFQRVRHNCEKAPGISFLKNNNNKFLYIVYVCVCVHMHVETRS